MPGKQSPGGGADARPPIERGEGKNNIVPFGLRKQRRLTQQLEAEQQRLRDLGTEATRAIDRQKIRQELNDLPNWIGRRSSQAAPDRLSRSRNRIAARHKRDFERATGRQVRVPRGTTQRQYEAIIDRLRSGDPQAIEQYTRKRQ